VVGRLLDAGAMAVITVLDGERTLADVAARRRKAGYSLAGERVDNEIEAFVTPELADRLLGAARRRPEPRWPPGRTRPTRTISCPA
jgi:hypothetical protein